MPPPKDTRFEKLNLIKAGQIGDGAVAVALCHNERTIIEEYFDHYRSIGVSSFIIVDDHSTDGSLQIALDQEDCTVLQPIEGSEYKTDKRAWRREVLNTFCQNRWVVLADIDEHLVWPGVETEDISGMITRLEAEGAQASYAVMLDMYQDIPLCQHGTSTNGPLKDRFPLFDANVPPPFGYRVQPNLRKFVEKWPCPPYPIHGGMRERVFFLTPQIPISILRFLIGKFAHLRKSLHERFVLGNLARLTHFPTRRSFYSNRFAIGKSSILKWDRSLDFSGGAHHLNKNVPISTQWSMLLHFKWSTGPDQLEYRHGRKQHAAGSRLYSHILKDRDRLSASPIFYGSTRYAGSQSIVDLANRSPRSGIPRKAVR